VNILRFGVISVKEQSKGSSVTKGSYYFRKSIRTGEKRFREIR